jgi:hypothetical protein
MPIFLKWNGADALIERLGLRWAVVSYSDADSLHTSFPEPLRE